MTKREYISSVFDSVRLSLTESNLIYMGIDDADSLASESDKNDLFIKFIRFIPTLLLFPTSISEGGTSISKATEKSIKAFYKKECKRLGLKNELAPKVRFR